MSTPPSVWMTIGRVLRDLLALSFGRALAGQVDTVGQVDLRHGPHAREV